MHFLFCDFVRFRMKFIQMRTTQFLHSGRQHSKMTNLAFLYIQAPKLCLNSTIQDEHYNLIIHAMYMKADLHFLSYILSSFWDKYPLKHYISLNGMLEFMPLRLLHARAMQ